MAVALPKLMQEYKDITHEPLMLQFTTLMQSSGKTKADIARLTGICPATIKNWSDRKTKRPNSSTLRMAFKALGYTLKSVK